MMLFYFFICWEYIEIGLYKLGIVYCYFLNINNLINCKINVLVIVVLFDKCLCIVYNRNF